MENTKQRLDKLKKRNEELKPLVFRSFDTMEELKKYKETEKEIFTEYFNNLEQIQQLEWELMTPEEQKHYLKEEEISKLKREGKL